MAGCGLHRDELLCGEFDRGGRLRPPPEQVFTGLRMLRQGLTPVRAETLQTARCGTRKPGPERE